MVRTPSSHPMIPLAGAPGASNKQEMVDFTRQMAESMDFIRKQNEDYNTWLTVVKARSSQREIECEKRHEKERRDNIHRGKWTVAPGQQDNKSTVQESHRTT